MDQERILISSNYYVTLLDIDLKKLKQVIMYASNTRFHAITCCRPGIKTGSSHRLFLSVNAYLHEDYCLVDDKPTELPNIYEGKQESTYNAWLIYCSVDLTKLKFVCSNYNTESMLLKNEYVRSICEFLH